MKNNDVKNESFKCPSCGADMKYDSQLGQLGCDFCDRRERLLAVNEDIEEFNFEAAENDESLNDWGLKTKTIKCSNCGAKTVTATDKPLVSCAFCGSVNIAPVQEQPGIRPESLIPFIIDMNKAALLFETWIKKRWLAPFALKKGYSSNKLRGVYIPYWSHDTQTKSSYIGQAGDYYNDTEMRTVTVDGKTETKPHKVQKVRWRFISGTFDKKFDAIMYNDSRNIDPKRIEKIEPYRLNELIKFDQKFMTGFEAEHYNSGLKIIWGRAKAFMRKSIRNDIRDILKRGSDVVGTVNISTHYTDIKYKHMLLPIWISSYEFKNKIYNFFVNGQTGEVQADSPKSVLKIGGIVLIILAVAAALYFILK